MIELGEHDKHVGHLAVEVIENALCLGGERSFEAFVLKVCEESVGVSE